MEILQTFYEAVKPYIPTSIALVAVIFALYIIRYILDRKFASLAGHASRRQLITLLISFVGLLIIIMVLPLSDTSRGQLLSLLGILISAAIALSSATFVGNLMAGFMLRAMRNFRPGNFIRVGDYFGRVSERGLFHVEIQTEDRDLTTIPNLYLITNPVKVIRPTGTIISATVSLGYDIPHSKVEKSLLEAARRAQLQDAFVHVKKLGDFSITYRIAGLLKQVKNYISASSRLRQMMLDSLHEQGIEIVSPTFMNTRALPESRIFIPAKEISTIKVKEQITSESPEEILFDKAEEAESIEKLQEKYTRFDKEQDDLKEKLHEVEQKEVQEGIKKRIEYIEKAKEHITQILKDKQENKE